MTETTILPLELRSSVEQDQHLLTGVCVPYGRVTLKAGVPQGERFVPGAFAKATSDVRPHGTKIRLTDSHAPGDRRRPVAVASDLRESAEALYGTFRFYDTPEGRGAYENVREGTYGGLSVGFIPVRERLAPDGVREVVEAKLFHVSLVDEPAYEEAVILAVRAAEQKEEADEGADERRARIAALNLDALVARSWDAAAFPNPEAGVTLSFEYGPSR